MDDSTSLLTPLAEEHEMQSVPFVRTSTVLLITIGVTACAIVIVILVGTITRVYA